MKITAKIIADSKGLFDKRLTTFVITFPRIVLAELNTHRMLSRNSASSRAIPFNKMLDRVQNDPFVPSRFQKDHSGMQGTEYLSGQDLDLAKSAWLRTRDKVLGEVKMMNHNIKVTKQLCNRLMEPWMWHTAIVTASDWENFFALRAHPAAEIHIAKLAEYMLDEYNKSQPKQLRPGEWHIPFGDNIDEADLEQALYNLPDTIEQGMVKVAVARCARVSYLNYEGNDDYSADLKLHDRLAKMGHWSPFEHCAKAMNIDEFHHNAILTNVDGKVAPEEHFGWCGNFRGFIQYRKMFDDENKQDHRVIRK